MYSLRSIDYDSISQTVEIGTGLKWDDVYAALEPHGVSVAGGRVTDVGVGGFTLGGGYSYKTSQYGLTLGAYMHSEIIPDVAKRLKKTTSPPLTLFFPMEHSLLLLPQTMIFGLPCVAPVLVILAL